MKQTYEFRDGTRLPKSVNPQRAGEIVLSLGAEEEGAAAVALVEKARPENSPIHDAFTWNDTKAAQERRLGQARYLIAAVVRVTMTSNVDTKVKVVKAFIHVPSRSGGAGTYVTPEVLSTDADRLGRALESTLHRFSGALKSLRELAALAPKSMQGTIRVVTALLQKAIRGLESI